MSQTGIFGHVTKEKEKYHPRTPFSAPSFNVNHGKISFPMVYNMTPFGEAKKIPIRLCDHVTSRKNGTTEDFGNTEIC